MKLSDEQIQVLTAIAGKIEYGDFKIIADATECSTDYVRKVLKPKYNLFNHKIVNEAVKLIKQREAKMKANLETLRGANI